MIPSGQVQFYDGLRDLLIPIDHITPAPWNYNNGDVEELVTSIEQNGMYRPVIYSLETREILAGNHTWLACRELGAEVIPAVGLDADEVTSWRINIADNEVAKNAKPDAGLLLDLLKKIEEQEGSVIGTGKTRRDMEEMEALSRMPLDTDRLQPDTENWPTLSIQMPPELLQAFLDETDGEDYLERFENLLRQAGWDG